MKLQIAFDITNIENALRIATDIEKYADIFEVGTPLIYTYGVSAVEQFKKAFPNKTILADTKILDRGKESAALFTKAGADWITVMAGAKRSAIHAACSSINESGRKIMLDLLDTTSPGQFAMEAKKLGVDALIFHEPEDSNEQYSLRERWDMIKGNADLPIFIAAHSITVEQLPEIIALQPDGIIIGKTIVDAQDPVAQAALFHAAITQEK